MHILLSQQLKLYLNQKQNDKSSFQTLHKLKQMQQIILLKQLATLSKTLCYQKMFIDTIVYKME